MEIFTLFSDRGALWLLFGFLILALFIADLGISRKTHDISFREALFWSVAWISLALLFNAGLFFSMGKTGALEFFTAYIIEKSLSVDNLFVFIMIFSYFQIPGLYQPKILKWGIIGAILMRAVFIFIGIGLLERFHWMIYLFGAVLIVTGIKMAFGKDEAPDPEKNIILRLVRKIMPVTKRRYRDAFFIRRKGVAAATPLFLALVMIETSDIVFAIDSIPAVLAVSRDPLIVYTSNIFAIMGLRALYFLLSSVMGMFTYLKQGISVVLAFVGIKNAPFRNRIRNSGTIFPWGDIRTSCAFHHYFCYCLAPRCRQEG